MSFTCKQPTTNELHSEADTISNDITDKNYQNYCASCHGVKLNGFIDKRNWTYGAEIEDISRVIAQGLPDDGMQAYGEVLSKEEIRDLALYVKSAGEIMKDYEFSDDPIPSTFKTEKGQLEIEKLVEDVGIPWGIAVVDNDQWFFTTREGELYQVNAGNKTKVKNVPKVKSRGQGGLMNVSLHPDFHKNQVLYLSYSKENPENSREATTAILMAKLEGNSLIDARDIFVAQPYHRTRHHYGSQITFDDRGHLFFSVGDRGNRDVFPQSLSNDCGKIHRIHLDGSIPDDNPFVDQEDAQPSIWSYGHRNPQGLFYDLETGILWEHEHGPRGGDELNVIVKGENYGWPIVSYGINYNGTTFTNETSRPEFKDPVHYWVPSLGACGHVVVSSDKYEDWKGNHLVGSLRFEFMDRVVLDGEKVIGEETLLPKIGRLRSIHQGADGYIYVGAEAPNAIYRLTLK